MSANVPSVAQLKELALPPPVSYSPQTWGWWLLLATLLLAAVIIGTRRLIQWRRDRYRREALAQLEQLRTNSDELYALRELPELLKRVALSMQGPRSLTSSAAAAALQSSEWQIFLQAHVDQPLPEKFAQQLATLAYAPDATLLALPAPRRDALFDTCRLWVERHHVAA
ncbi:MULTISPECIES: DUF4381 domain-containing protein [unclassified Pseudomonas]|jgi:hypothetical protein|uniref:DUF4381 domain-containing protein n=1 Tax=unclassified Pseudomonas TaxID=196821 RepID=UPI000A1FC6AD|nr:MULTISPECIES: DUF4381 domain-containing protein [unclassified Pseudomonas]MCH4901828.1 DUF4381 family protein [Pseudomonas sp. B707]